MPSENSDLIPEEVIEEVIEEIQLNTESLLAQVVDEPVLETVNWEEKCVQLEKKISALTEATRLRKRLIEIREIESENLKSKLAILSDSISEEKKSRGDLMKRVEVAEMECMKVKDKLKRNLEALERVKGHHERRVTVLTANVEIAEIKATSNTRKLDESHRKNAELKGLLEELNLKLNETKKVAKGFEKNLKKSQDRNKFLTSQVSLISEILVDDVEGINLAVVGGDEGYLKIKKILKQSEEPTKPQETETETGDKKGDEDEGVELSSLLDMDCDDEEEIKEDIPGEESCYKEVITSTGPQLILSVSKTFIKLKDLILEKRSLQQAIDNFKGLNTRLESKVDKQERRLYCVTKELNKTWSLVSKLKMQQDRLHTNEAFLRFELKENRAIVQRLKKEMQIYKEKWQAVKEKNDESQAVWQELKDEFAQRRLDGHYRSRRERCEEEEKNEEEAKEEESPSSSTTTPPSSPPPLEVEEEEKKNDFPQEEKVEPPSP